MITDAHLLFSDGQAVTVDANSTNVIDLVATPLDLSRGGPARFRAQVDVVMDSAAEAATLEVKLVESAAENLSSPTVLWTSGVLAEATLVAGYIIADTVVPRTSKRYIGVIYDNAGEAFTTGNITAEILLDTETAQADRVLGNTGL